MEKQEDIASQYSLKEICKNRLKNLFHSIQKDNPGSQVFMLVADEKSVRVISSFMKMSDLMEFGISAIEKLELKRKPFPKMHAIYVITPSEATIGHLIQDFADKKKPQYAAVHLFVTNRIPP